MKSTTGATALDKKIIDKWIQMQCIHNKLLMAASEGQQGGMAPAWDFGRQINLRQAVFALWQKRPGAERNGPVNNC
jgi:hypothetical protein